jgi:hypothetical protein
MAYNHNGYGIIQLFSIVGLLGSPSMPQNHFLSIIPFLRKSGVKKLTEIKLKMLYCELIVKFQNWTCLWDSTNFKMGIIGSLIPAQYILD